MSVHGVCLAFAVTQDRFVYHAMHARRQVCSGTTQLAVLVQDTGSNSSTLVQALDGLSQSLVTGASALLGAACPCRVCLCGSNQAMCCPLQLSGHCRLCTQLISFRRCQLPLAGAATKCWRAWA